MQIEICRIENLKKAVHAFFFFFDGLVARSQHKAVVFKMIFNTDKPFH